MEKELLLNRKYYLLHHVFEKEVESYEFRFPNRSLAQAKKYAKKQIKPEITKIDNRLKELEYEQIKKYNLNTSIEYYNLA